jgi:hypothetical protein
MNRFFRAYTISPRRIILVGLAFSALALIVGCRSQSNGDLQALIVTNRRFVIDSDHNVVRIYGRLENMGDSRFRQVEVRAFLKSPGGNQRGENMVLLNHIAPYEKRNFALSVTSHSQVNDVIIEIRAPEHH